MSASDLKAQISNPTSNFAIIVAGGSGSRMQAALPKQFLLLNGLPILMHTLKAFQSSAAKPQLVLVLHADYHELWRRLCEDYNFNIVHQLIKGGETRFHSVKNGLDVIDNTSAVIAIHDAVRPLTSTVVIDKSYKFATEHGNAITAVKSRDSIRQMQDGHTISLLREDIYLVQTPQTYQWSVLKKAYDQDYDLKFTDDASVVESVGVKINLIEGSYENIKITFPEDICIAEAILNKKPST